MWPNPLAANIAQAPADDHDDKNHQSAFDEFYEDVFEELSNYGEVEELKVCENLGGHLVGNVYVKFRKEDEALDALSKLLGRFYGGMRCQSIRISYSFLFSYKLGLIIRRAKYLNNTFLKLILGNNQNVI